MPNAREQREILYDALDEIAQITTSTPPPPDALERIAQLAIKAMQDANSTE